MKKILIFAGLVLVGALVFLATRVNREDLSFQSKYSSLNTNKLKQNKGLYLILTFKPSCPGVKTEFPELKSKLDLLKNNNIPYYLVADVIYNKSADTKLMELAKKYNLQDEKIYLMDRKEFPKNGGILNSAERYGNFIKAVTNSTEVPLAGTLCLTMNGENLQSFAPFIELEKLPLHH